MNALRKLLLPLLLAALLLGMLPSVEAAPRPDEPDYTCADEIFDRIYGRLLGRKAPSDEQSRADSVERLLAEADGVVPGSVRRAGNELTWQTEGGVACRYSPYLHSLASAKAPEPGQEQKEAPDPSKEMDDCSVCLIAPYYGLDDSFEGLGGNYDSWGATLAKIIGGDYTRFERTEATVDRIAEAVETCDVVLIDSHGEMDEDQTTSYICLQTSEGITAADYAADSATGISHAYYGGKGSGGISFYEVDGTVISNHMKRPAAGGLFWSGTCYGMATDGLCGPLLKQGIGAFYGYSRDVSFGGDSCWMSTFMEVLTGGGTVAEAVTEMKRTWGAWDFSPEICAFNDWSAGLINHSAEEAKRSGDAFPVVASPRDPFPADPNSVQTVLCGWQLPRMELTLHLVVPDGVKCADISAYVYYTGTLPKPEGRPRNPSHSYSFVGWSPETFADAQKLPVALYRAGDAFSFGYDDPDPLSFGDESVTFYAVYTYKYKGKNCFTTEVPAGEYDPYDPSAKFSDMAYGTWYYRSVRDCFAMGLIKGYQDGTFRPNATIRRCEVVTILYRAAGSPETAAKTSFPDVPTGCFYEKAMCWATKKGIARGFSDGLFHPDEPVTRAQLAALVCRYAGARGGRAEVLNSYPDRDDVQKWAKKAMAWAVQNDLIRGVSAGGKDYLQPNGLATRAQFTAILNRYLSNPT